MTRILVVEDDKDLATMVCEAIQTKSTLVDCANSVEEAVTKISISNYDLAILDWNLPDATGLEVCREYKRKAKHGSVLFLTQRSSIDYKEEAYLAGTDDYLTKPFHLNELIARVNSLLRRKPTREHTLVTCGSLLIDFSAYVVHYRGRPVSLIPTDFNLLTFLAKNPSQVFGSRELLSSVWRQSCSQKAVRQSVNRLRQRLRLGKNELIESVRGGGYRLVDSPRSS